MWSSLGPLGVGSSVYLGAGGTADVDTNCSASLQKLDKATGNLQWRSRTGIQIQGRAGFGEVSGRVYVGDYDNCLYAFDGATGRRLWRTCTKGRLEASSAVAAFQSAIAATRRGNGSNSSSRGPRQDHSQARLPDGGESRDIVVVGSGDGSVYGFEGSTGTIAWSTRLGKPVSAVGPGGVGSSTALYNDQHGMVAAVGGPDAMWGLDARTGEVRWRWGAPKGGMFGSSPLVRDGCLYVGGEDGWLYALVLPYVSKRGT